MGALLRCRWILVSVILGLVPSGAEASLLLSGPKLTGDTLEWRDSGIEFTALRDGKLESFIFENQGRADTISLTDGSDVLFSIDVPAGQPSFFVEVDWPLKAGAGYQLIGHDPDNGRWTAFRDYPLANSDISVNFAIGNDATEKAYWFSFVDIQTLGHAPEPSSAAMFLPLLMLALRRTPRIRCR